MGTDDGPEGAMHCHLPNISVRVGLGTNSFVEQDTRPTRVSSPNKLALSLQLALKAWSKLARPLVVFAGLSPRRGQAHQILGEPH